MASTTAPPGTSAVRQSSRQTRTNPSRVSKTAGRQSTLPSSSLTAGSSQGQYLPRHHHHHHHHLHHHHRRLNHHQHHRPSLGAPGNPGSFTAGGAGAGIDPATAASMGPTMPDDIYPGITHFTDTMDAIPREFRRHESLLKEVDGKSWVLEERLPALVGAAAEQIMRPSRSGVRPGEESTHPAKVASPQSEPSEVASRRQMLQNIRNTLTDLLPTMDEKNHVARNANKELKKQLQRLSTAYSFVEGEVSDEARLGSLTHWAYVKIPVGKAGGKGGGSGRPKRETAAQNDEAKRDAVGIRKQRRNQAEADADYGRAKGKGQAAGKTKADTGSGDRGAAAATGSSAAQGGGAAKRRKVEKPPQAGTTTTTTSAAMERTASTNTTTGRGGGKAGTNATDAAKGRGRGATNAAATTTTTTATTQRKRANTSASNAGSPSLAAASLASTAGNAANATSPAPGNTNRPQSTARGQPASTQPGNNGRQRPPTSTTGRAQKKSTTDTKKDPGGSKSGLASVKAAGSNGEGMDSKFGLEAAGLYNMANPESLPTSDAPAMGPPSRARSSKTSTPAMSNITETPQQQRSRPLRSTEGGGTAAKRSHKKGGSTVSAAARQAVIPAPAAPAEDEASSRQGDDEEDDESEPRYCYCNQVSFGEMVACDNDDCPREWFHLSCVGMTKPPLKSAKWYCNECKEGMKKTKSGNGR